MSLYLFSVYYHKIIMFFKLEMKYPANESVTNQCEYFYGGNWILFTKGRKQLFQSYSTA